MLPFDGIRGICGENSCNVCQLLFIELWVLISVMLCMRAVLMLWHAFLFLGLRPVGFSPLFPFLLGGFHCFLLLKKKIRVRDGNFSIKYCAKV
jgi:hypothetical protein